MLLYSCFFFKRVIRTPGTPWFSIVWVQKFGGASHYETMKALVKGFLLGTCTFFLDFR